MAVINFEKTADYESVLIFLKRNSVDFPVYRAEARHPVSGWEKCTLSLVCGGKVALSKDLKVGKNVSCFLLPVKNGFFHNSISSLLNEKEKKYRHLQIFYRAGTGIKFLFIFMLLIER